MYAVVIEFEERYWQKNCDGIVDCICFIADVMFKEKNEKPTKIWIDKIEVE